MALIGHRLSNRQLIDGAISRFVYALIRPAVTKREDERNSDRSE
jgi:hypothetical protein